MKIVLKYGNKVNILCYTPPLFIVILTGYYWNASEFRVRAISLLNIHNRANYKGTSVYNLSLYHSYTFQIFSFLAYL